MLYNGNLQFSLFLQKFNNLTHYCLTGTFLPSVPNFLF